MVRHASVGEDVDATIYRRGGTGMTAPRATRASATVERLIGQWLSLRASYVNQESPFKVERAWSSRDVTAQDGECGGLESQVERSSGRVEKFVCGLFCSVRE